MRAIDHMFRPFSKWRNKGSMSTGHADAPTAVNAMPAVALPITQLDIAASETAVATGAA